MPAPDPSVPAPPPPPPAAPCLQAPGETSMGVVWAVHGLAHGEVEVADNPAFRGARTFRGGPGLLPTDERILRVRLGGLRPATKYWYRTTTYPLAATNGGWNVETAGAPVRSQAHAFTTLGAGCRGHFCVVQDLHGTGEAYRLAVRKLRALAPELAVWNGDAASGLPDRETAVATYLAPPVPEAGWQADLPVAFMPGNHEFRGVWATHLPEAQLPRDAAERAPADAALPPWTFAARLGDAALLVLDTGEDKPDGHPKWHGLADHSAARRAQAAWLERALARPDIRAARHKIALCHLPLLPDLERPGRIEAPWDGSTVDPDGYAYWSRECRDLWGPILERGGVRLALVGHDHKFFVRPPEPGRSWTQVAGGGPELGEEGGRPAPARFPTVTEGLCTDAGLRLRVHDLLHDRVVFDETF